MAKILVVDDRPSNRDYLKTVLIHDGHSVYEAGDGREGLAAVGAVHPDLAIVDILMPSMDGYEFVRRLRENPELASTRAVFTSAHYLESETLSLAQRCGVTHFIPKPCEPDVLLDILHKVLQSEPNGLVTDTFGSFDREHLGVVSSKLSKKTEELKATQARVFALMEVSRELFSCNDFRDLSERYSQATRNIMAAELCIVRFGQQDSPSTLVRCAGSRGGAEAAFVPAWEAGKFHRQLLRSGTALSFASSDGLPFECGAFRVESFLGAPIASGNETHGWIGLFNKIGFLGFRDEDSWLLAVVAAQLAVAFDNQTLAADSRRNAEALRLKEEQLRALVRNTPDRIYMKDIEGRFLIANPACEALFGAPESDIIGSRLIDLPMDPASTDELTRNDNYVIQSGRSMQFEEELETSAGRRVFLSRKFPVFNPTGRPHAVCGISTDITEWKRTEQALIESTAQLELALHTSGLGTWDFNLSTGAISGSARLCAIFGLDKVREKSDLLDRIHPEDRELVEAEFLRATSSQSNPELDFRIVTPDGALHWAIMKATAITGPDGSVLRTIGVVRDITGRKMAEREICQLNAELEQRVRDRTAQLEASNKELEAFAYSVSHDLRAPLRGIDGWSLALKEDYGENLDEKARLYLDRVRSETQRMGNLIDDLLQLSRLTRSEMHFAPVDLTSLAQDIAGRLQEATPERRLCFNIETGLAAHGDSRLLDVALSNLISNAVKFTASKDIARIEIGRFEASGTPTFFVRDNGIGFDMAYASNLFGAFQRLHKPSEFAGNGIGLATVQRVIRRHGGKIWALAEPDRGATFYFTLATPESM